MDKSTSVQTFISALNSQTHENVVRLAQEICQFENFSELESHLVTELLNSLANYGLLPSIPQAEERELEKNDFSIAREKCILSCECLKVVLNGIHHLQIQASVLPLLLFCSQHVEFKIWSSKKSVSLGQEVLELIQLAYLCTNIKDLLVADDETCLLKKVFRNVLPFLTRSTWKRNPGMMASFEWLLLNTKHPYVGEVLNEVLPPSLLFVDDFVLNNRISGIRCLHHILDNCPAAELQWYGRIEVIYNALNNLVHIREPAIITAVYPCLLKVLSILEKDPQKPLAVRRVNKFDVLYQVLLNSMDHEQTIALRKAYSQQFSLFGDIFGITMLRHLKSTLRIVFQYLEIYDDPNEITRVNCLKFLQNIIKITWPRMKTHLTEIVKAIVRLIYDINCDTSYTSSKKEVIENCMKCLTLLQQLMPKEFDVIVAPLISLTSDIPSLEILSLLKSF